MYLAPPPDARWTPVDSNGGLTIYTAKNEQGWDYFALEIPGEPLNPRWLNLQCARAARTHYLRGRRDL